MLAQAASESGAPRVAHKLQEGFRILSENDLDRDARQQILDELSTAVLNTAKRFGKARFGRTKPKTE